MLPCAYAIAEESNEPLPQIVFYTENYPPGNYIDNGELTGLTVETLNKIWLNNEMDKPIVNVYPWARAYHTVLVTEDTALFTIARTRAREKLFKWVGPLFESKYVLVAKKNRNIKPKNLNELFSYRVACIRFQSKALDI